MIDRFINFIQEKELFDKESYVIVATSGGMDSVVLCHLLHKSGYNFGIAHCNFGLRGEESDQDELFVKKLAKKYKVPFYIKHFETNTYCEKEKISIQMAARILRYAWFEELIKTENAEKILTAHHSSDSAETVILNLVRGTGLSGLHGIKAKSGFVSRPLLFATKEDIMSVVAESQLNWREDSSNESIKYRRNYIRHKVIPLLKELNPNLDQTIEDSIEKIALAETVFNEKVNEVEKEILEETGIENYRLAIEKIRDKKNALIYLFEILKKFRFNLQQCKDIIYALDGEPGKIFASPTFELIKDRDYLFLSPKNLDQFSSAFLDEDLKKFERDSFTLKIQTLPSEGYKISSSNMIAALDKTKLTFPLEIRNWKDGDWFFPLGMNKKKKISDFLIDQKVPLNVKKGIKVLTSNGSITWVIGYRIDNRYKISDQTTEILELTNIHNQTNEKQIEP